VVDREVFTLNRIYLFFTLITIAVTAPHADAAYNTIDNVILTDEGGYSSITVVFTGQAKEYRVDPNLSEMVIRVYIPKAGIGTELYTEDLQDRRIKNIRVDMNSSGDAMAEIYIRDIKTSVYHSLSGDGKSLTLRLKSRNSLMIVDTDKKAAKTRQARKKKEEGLIKEVEDIQKFAGRDLYLEAMVAFQKNEFDIAEKKFMEFMSRYPDSIYREKAAFMHAETIYRVSKKKRERTREALDAFRLAAASFPVSGYSIRAKLRIADLYHDMKMNLEAVAVYESIVRSDPEGKFTLSALKGKANVYLIEEKYSLAYNELEKILLLFPAAREAREARFRIAEAFFLRKRYETAARIFEDSNEKWPSFVRANPATLQHFADTYYFLGRKEEALNLYVELMNLFPDQDEGRFAVNRIADMYISQNNKKAALRLLETQARKIPNLPHGLESRLRLAALGHSPAKLINPNTSFVYEYKDYIHPLDTYNEIIKKHGKTTQAREALYQKAQLMNQEKRYIESILALKTMMKNFPKTQFDEKVVWLVKDSLYKTIHNLHDQEGFYTILAVYYDNFDPFLEDIKDAEVVMKVAEAYYEMGLFEKASERFHEAAVLDKQGILQERLRLGKGKVDAGLGNFAEAEETLRPFADRLDTSVYSADAVHLLADVYYLQNKTAEAVDAYERAINLNREHRRVSESAYYLGQLEKSQGNYQDSIDHFNLSIEKGKRFIGMIDTWQIAESQYQMIESAYLAKRYKDALDLSQTALDLYPDNHQSSWAKYLQSDSQLKINEDEKAKESFKSLAETEPDSIFGKVASATLETMQWKQKHKELFAN